MPLESHDIVAGYLEVGANDKGEVVINHPDLKPDAQGIGHIVFSKQQARSLALSLLRQAGDDGRVPVVSPQQLIDAGINGFAMQLVVESIAKQKFVGPIRLMYRGLLFTIEHAPGEEIDGRHH